MTREQSTDVPGRPNPTWWRDAVIYQIYIRSFADGNGDGMGDIAGIRSRLPYLAELGVDAIWITPWYSSPMADGGYDVADFRAIAPEFGTLDEAEAMLADAHRHGLRVLLDVVPNHTSDQHAWFQAALSSGPGSPERARYWFRNGRGPDGSLPPNDWLSTFGGPAWTQIEDGSWYLHLFASQQPDLNWDNPEVRREFADDLSFWFDRGVDGFRIDVAHGLSKHPELPDLGGDTAGLLTESAVSDHPHWDRDAVHEIYREWRRIADSYAGTPQGPRVYVAEAWVRTCPERLANYMRPDELHSAFNFEFLMCPWDATQLREGVNAHLTQLDEVGAPTTWVLSNHDVIRPVTRYGRPDGEEFAPAGHVATDLALGRRRARAATMLMLALPGGAYIYQGEELGLPEVEDLPVEALQDPIWERSGHTHRGRDGCRVPLPWSREQPSYGFGSDGAWLPQPPYWADLSVEAQAGDEASTLELFRAALHLRSSLDLGRAPPLSWVEVTKDTLVFDRGDLRCAVNLGEHPIAFPAHEELLLTSTPLADAQLPGSTAVWLRTT